MNALNEKSLEHPSPETDLARRSLALSLVALLGGALLPREAQALPKSALLDFFTVNRLLAKYGLQVSGRENRALARDVIDVDTQPVDATEYRATVSLPSALGAIVPCIRTSYFDGHAEFTHFDSEASPGEIVPCVKIIIAHDDPREIVPCIFEHYNAHVGDQPILRTGVRAHEMGYTDLLDPNAGADSAALARMGVQWNDDAVVKELTLDIHDASLPLTVNVAGRRYVLSGGRLGEVEEV